MTCASAWRALGPELAEPLEWQRGDAATWEATYSKPGCIHGSDVALIASLAHFRRLHASLNLLREPQSHPLCSVRID